MRVVVVVQARMGSSRLPGKVLLPAAGAPLLQRMLERVLAAEEPDDVCVATTLAAADEPIRELARQVRVPVVSGHPTDLIDRHLQAGRDRGAEEVDLRPGVVQVVLALDAVARELEDPRQRVPVGEVAAARYRQRAGRVAAVGGGQWRGEQ